MQSYPNSVGGGQIGVMATPPAQRELALCRVIDQLNAEITSQESLISKLDERLRPALRQIPANAAAKLEERLSECVLATTIAKLAMRVNANNEAINYLITNLEF